MKHEVRRRIDEACCADIFKTGAAQGSAAESQRAFGALMRSVQAAGALNEKAKELILFSLVVAEPLSAVFRRAFSPGARTGHHAGGIGRGGVVRHRDGRRAGEDVLSGKS